MDAFKIALVLLALAMGAVTAPAAILALALVSALALRFSWPKVQALWGRSRLLRSATRGVLFFGALGLLFLGAGYGRVLLGGTEGAPNDKVSFAPYGEGYSTYSWLGNGILGRQYARRDVREVLTRAFASRGEAGRTHILADVGWRSAGDGRKGKERSLSGHHSHKFGLAVDVHLPIMKGGEPTTLPTTLFTLWGYGWRFDAKGRSEALAFDVKGKGCKHRPKKGIAIPLDPGYEIDLDELARLLAAVHDAAKESPTTRLTRVILWPPLQRALKRRPAYKELFGRGTGRRIRFNTSCEWFIHDEHVHLHFKS